MTAQDPPIVLRHGETLCRLHPQHGGAIGSLAIGGIEVLRKAPPLLADPLRSAAFAMVPFANRVFAGTRLGGAMLYLPPDPEGAPAALHGHGWRRAWQAELVSADRALLSYQHCADAWPWSYRAAQQFALTSRGLELGITVTNLSAQPMPVGLGLHPFMARHADSFVDIAATRCLNPDPRGMPAIPAPWTTGRRNLHGAAPCDAFLLTTSGSARFGQRDWAATIATDAAAGWQLYCPFGKDFYCLEPANHRPGQIGENAGGAIIDPGTSTSWNCTIQLD